MKPARLVVAGMVLVTLVLSSSRPSSGQQRPTFTSSVERVRVDVIVTGREGRFLRSLGPSDFTVMEDGERQEIVDFQLVDLRSGQVRRGEAAANPAPEPLMAAAELADFADSTPETAELGAIVFLVDILGLDAESKLEFAHELESFIERTELNAPRGIWIVDHLGRIRELAPLTMDNAVLREAAAQLVAEPVTARSIYDRLNTDYALMLHEVFDGQPGAPARLRFRALIDATDERNRGERHLEQLSQFVRALSAREGRKALVWVSAGLQTSEGGAFSAIVAQTLGTGQVVNGLPGGQNRGATPTPELTFNDHMMPHARSRDLQEALYATANASNVAIYAVDPTPKHRYRRTATAAARNVQVSDVMSSPTVQGAIDSTRGVLTEAARETGGRSFIGWSELDTALDELATDTSAYYLLYYVPSTTRAPGTYHEIDVEVAFPDADVRARPGYLETTPEEARAERVAAALALPGLLFSQGLDSAVYRRVGSADEVSAWLALHVPAFVPEPFSDGEPVPALRLHLLALDENAVVQHEERLEIRSRGGSATDSIDGGIDYVHELKLERGDYELRVAVEEIVSGRLLGARLQLHASAPDEGGWEASDLVPIAMAPPSAAGGSSRRGPLAVATVPSGAALAAYVEVGGGSAPVLLGQVHRLGEPAPMAQLAPQQLQRVEGSGHHFGALSVPQLPAGEYILRATLTDPPANQYRRFELPLTVAPRSGGELGIAAAEAPGGAAKSGGDVDDPAELDALLPGLLERLGRLAELYRDEALSFVADETIVQHKLNRRPETGTDLSPAWRHRFLASAGLATYEHRFEYIYGFDASRDAATSEAQAAFEGLEELPETLADARFVDFRRKRGSDEDDRPPEQILADFNLDGFLSRAYSWAFIFSPESHESYRYQVLRRDEIAGRRALAVGFAPRTSDELGWIGTAWVDAESSAILQVEAYLLPEFRELQRLSAARAGDGGREYFEFTTTFTELGVERNGLRFPSRVETERTFYSVRGDGDERETREYTVFRTEQIYDNYRFFSVRTEAEVRDRVRGTSAER